MNASKLNRAYLMSQYKYPSDLGTIIEQSYYSRTEGLSNSQKFSFDMENSIKRGQNTSPTRINASMVIPINNDNKSQLFGNGSPRNRSGILLTSPRQTQVSPRSKNADTQVIMINNRKFVTSKSPNKSRLSEIDENNGVHPLKPKPQNRNIQNKVLSPRYLEQISSPIHQTSSNNEILRSYSLQISSLEMKIVKLEQQKKHSIVNLLKQRLQLKTELNKIQNQRDQLQIMLKQKQEIIQSIGTKNMSEKLQVREGPSMTEKLIKLEVDQKLERIREQNIAMKNELTELKIKLEDGQNIPVIIFPKEIPLNKGQSETSLVIGANWQRLLNNMVQIEGCTYESSMEEVREDTEQYNIDQIICNIQQLTFKNKQLEKINQQREKTNAQLLKKVQQLSQQVLQQEGQLQIRDIIAKETAQILKDITLVLAHEKNPQIALKKVKEIMRRVDEESDIEDQESKVIDQFLSSYV